jgi:alpha-tectorin
MYISPLSCPRPRWWWRLVFHLQCSAAQKAKIRSDDFCGVITDYNNPFYWCQSNLTYLDLEAFQDRCEVEVCDVQGRNREMKQAACGTLSALAQICAEHGFLVDWRTPTRCRKLDSLLLYG